MRINYLPLLAILFVGCTSKLIERNYFIQDLIKDVDREASQQPLPPAWGDSWVLHWENIYSRLKKYRQSDAEEIINKVEMERRKRGLPKVDYDVPTTNLAR